MIPQTRNGVAGELQAERRQGMERVALVMIVRDEAGCLARCLRSAAPFVDEIIVLDTGSTDDTVSIARQFGATVHHYCWSDDFAAARNAALDYSTAQWNLILDADEWLDDSAAQLTAHLRGQDPFIGLLPVSSAFDLQGRVEVALSWISRILPRGVRYQGRIHEQPDSSLARRRVPVAVGHDGYRHDSLLQKKGRNEALLLRALGDEPSNAYLLYQLGKNHEVYEQYDAAVGYYIQALALSGMGASFRHDLVARALFSLKKAQRHEQAIQLAEEEMPNWPHSPDFFFILGDILLDMATLNPATAPELLPIIESSWRKCLEIGDQPNLEGSVTGRGSFLAAHNLAVLYDGLGDAAQADHYRRRARGPMPPAAGQ